MPDIREVYDMVTEQKPPEPGALVRQQTRQVRTARNKKIGAFAVAAAIALAAVVVVLVTRPEADTSAPAGTTNVVDPEGAAAVQVVTDFRRAMGSYDASKALTYLADDADLTGFIGGTGSFAAGSEEGFRLQLAWDAATGYKETLTPCEVTGSVAGTISVRCTYEWQGLRSDEMGLGPYGGASTTYFVRDGLITGTGSGSFSTEEFSPQVWEPFAHWVSKNYPNDFDVMYSGGGNNRRLTEESIALWEQHTQEYVKRVNRGIVG